MGDDKTGDTFKMELEEKETIIREQAETIRNLEIELERVRKERDELLKKLSALSTPAGDLATDDTRWVVEHNILIANARANTNCCVLLFCVFLFSVPPKPTPKLSEALKKEALSRGHAFFLLMLYHSSALKCKHDLLGGQLSFVYQSGWKCL